MCERLHTHALTRPMCPAPLLLPYLSPAAPLQMETHASSLADHVLGPLQVTSFALPAPRVTPTPALSEGGFWRMRRTPETTRLLSNRVWNPGLNPWPVLG